jgi:hypothetical protein
MATYVDTQHCATLHATLKLTTAFEEESSKGFGDSPTLLLFQRILEVPTQLLLSFFFEKARGDLTPEEVHANKRCTQTHVVMTLRKSDG